MVDKAVHDRDSNLLRGGLVPGGEGQAAYDLFQRKPTPLPILIAVPHAGTIYPADLVAQMRAPDSSCLRLEDRLVDRLGAAVARQTGASLLVARAPRAMIDLNRSTDDMDWDMVAGGPPLASVRFAAGRRARSGLGPVPRRLPGVGELWKGKLAREELNARIELVHRPYHAVLAQTLEGLRDRWGAALLLDLHSMPPLGRKHGRDAAPDFVIGDRYGSSCGAGLSAAAIDHFTTSRIRAAHNRPYAGGYVLDRHSAPARGVHAVQLEVCRSIYLDAALEQLGPGLESATAVVSGLVRRLAEELAAGSNRFPQAAE